MNPIVICIAKHMMHVNPKSAKCENEKKIITSRILITVTLFFSVCVSPVLMHLNHVKYKVIKFNNICRRDS